ncbi:HlyD family secretion protein [Congregibacter variabilis]|uniref:HlyD family secretion protein n=1 Tax=Congregibacter variabilis TaxID=3081200 RepID=A0ABZ0I3Y5_9GAMM|nr:HlyD family secretion protein [Congregibacter sp. IMCC43200]
MSNTQAEANVEATPAINRTTWVLLAVIVSSLAWYLLSDRYAPYTSQARVQGYVIGVAPEVAGTVTKVLVSNNQEVEEGDALFEIDPSQYQIALSRAESDLVNARSQVEAGNATVASARANLTAAKANELRASQDYARLKRLRETDPGTLSLRRLESSKASLDQARAKVVAAESDIQRAIEQKGGDDEGSNAILLSAQSAVEKARLDLANTVVKASSRGLITDLRADVGQYAGTGKPVMTLIAIHDLWIDAAFTENNLGHMHPGSKAEIVFDALPGAVFPGKVRNVGLGVSAGQAPAPGTLPTVSNSRDWLRQAQRFPVEVGFEMTDNTMLSQLRIGGQASVIVYSDGSTVLRLLGQAYIRLMSWFSYAY